MIYLLVSVLLFSLNNVLWKKNLEFNSIPLLISYRAFFTTLISFFVLVYIGIDWQFFLGFSLLRVTIGSLFGVMGLFCMLSAIKNAPLQWLGVYNMIGILFTALYLYLFEKVDFTDSILGLLLIGIGFLLYILSQRNSTKSLPLKQHLLLVSMVLGFGISSVLHWKNLDAEIPAMYILFNQELIVLLVSSSIVYVSSSSKSACIPNSRAFFLRVMGMALVIFLGLFFSFMGLEATNPLISSVLFLATPLLTIFLGALFFKEDITIINIISIVLIAVGAFWMHYYALN